MIKIKEYSDKFDEQLKAIDMITFYTVKYHSDVIKPGISAVVDGRKLIGVSYLKAGASFLKVDERELPYYFIHAEYITDEGADVETQVEASELMLEDLKGKFADIQSRYNDKRLILRLWCNTEKTAYQEFLMAHGFRPMRVLPILVRELTEDDVREKDSIVLPGNEKLEIKEMNPHDDGFMKEYTVTNREAFEVEDSENELRFVMGGEDSHVFSVMNKDRVIAAVTLWKITESRAATENIFCAADYRNKGITSALLKYVFGYLKEKGYDVASLTVFGDNQPATQLYFKLGYELEGNMLELHYETEYSNIGF